MGESQEVKVQKDVQEFKVFKKKMFKNFKVFKKKVFKNFVAKGSTQRKHRPKVV